jgi:hypothetical protein
VFDIIKEKMYKSSIINCLITSSEQYLNNVQLYSGREQDYMQDIKSYINKEIHLVQHDTIAAS